MALISETNILRSNFRIKVSKMGKIFRQSAINLQKTIPKRQLFSSSAQLNDKEEKLDKLNPSRRDLILKNAPSWLQMNAHLNLNNKARNWLHPNRPFPKNPWFSPPVPVGDEEREKIYTTYISNPGKMTVRMLATKFKLSVIRIEAILRLKHLERKQGENGYILQDRFTRDMEIMYGVGSKERLTEREDMKVQIRKYSRPTFVAWNPEDEDLPDNPAKEIIPKFSTDRRSDGNYVLPLSGIIEDSVSVKEEILEKNNPLETNKRWAFIIADIGDSSDEKRILVRDRDGTLRTARVEEREQHMALYPGTPKNQENSLKPKYFWRV